MDINLLGTRHDRRPIPVNAEKDLYPRNEMKEVQDDGENSSGR